MDFKLFAFEYGWIIAVLLLIALFLIVVFKRRGKEAALTKAREIAYGLMLQAEKRFGPGDGPVKMDWVANTIWPLLPKTAQFVLTQGMLTELLEDVYATAKDLLDDGQMNDSVECG